MMDEKPPDPDKTILMSYTVTCSIPEQYNLHLNMSSKLHWDVIPSITDCIKKLLKNMLIGIEE